MKNNKGFTLVELLVVIVILGIVTGLSIPLLRNVRENNEKKEYSTYMDTLEYSAKLYIDSY
jgi:general secretion pathway protein G